MSWTQKSIHYIFIFIFSFLPLLFLPFTSELFEFNKMIGVYLATLGILFLWCLRCLIEKRLVFKTSILDIPLVIFLVIQLVSLAYSIDPRTSLMGYYSRFNGGFLSFLSYAVLYWAAISNLDRKSTLTIINWSLISSALVASWGVAEHFGADASMWVQDVKNRVFSTLGQPNWLAAYLVALIFIPISKIVSDHKRNLWLNLLLSTLLFLVLLYTKSRSGLLAFAFSSVIFWGIIFLKNRLTYLKHFTVFSIITLSLVLTIANPLRDLYFSLQPAPNNIQTSGTSLETGGTESGTIRQIVWEGAIKIWQSSPKNFWLGSGPETFAQSYYQYRPQAHNSTSEWELLYNKAHNEFLNYLATTGLLGLASYLLLLIFMVKIFVSHIKTAINYKLLTIGLFSGWLSLSITNFWGFSVVIIQVFLFLFPAFIQALNHETKPTPPTQQLNFFTLMILLGLFSTGLYILGRYYIADIHYAAGQKSLRSFSVSQDPQYILDAYQSLTQAYQLNSSDAPIVSEMGNAAAYMALLLSESDATSAAEFAKISVASANRAINLSPYHPNYYKSAARSLIILGTINTDYFSQANEILKQAQNISPTDPRLPYNRGIIAKYLGQKPAAIEFFTTALHLKPDFDDALNQLSLLEATPSANQK